MQSTLRTNLAYLVTILLVLVTAQSHAGVLSGMVTDSSATPIPGVLVTVVDTLTIAPADSAFTEESGQYAIDVADGVYDVYVDPPDSTGLASAIIENVLIDGITALDIVIYPAGSLELSGILRDRDGVPIPSQTVSLGNTFATTDAFGGYALAVEPGSYALTVSGGGGGAGDAILPNVYSLSSDPFEVAADMEQDLSIENVLLHITVQDTLGNPVPDVGLEIPFLAMTPEFEFFGGLPAISGFLLHNTTTDADGVATFPLLRTLDAISIGVQPPSGSGFLPFVLSDIVATEDMNLVVILVADPTVGMEPTPELSTRLIGNFPNPFNPSTTLRFSLARATRVRIDLFDSRGVRVARLLDGVRRAGLNEVRWDGRSSSGQAAASGIYFVHFRTSDVTETRKIMLLK